MNTCNTEHYYNQYKESLLQLIQSKVDQNVAEDIVHDAFEKFEKCAQSDCSCEYPKAYLFRMALNTLADFFKRKNKSTQVQNSAQSYRF